MSPKNQYLIILIFFLSVFCSVIFLFFFSNIGPSEHRAPTSDYLAYYEPIANDIIRGKGIIFDRKFFINIPPLYPIFLSGIFSLSHLIGINRLDLILIFNVIISAFSCCFLFLIAKEIFNKRIALITSLLWMSYPFNLWFVKNTHTEIPFILLFYSGLLLYILAFKKRSLRLAFFGGLILGLSYLCRWISLFLPLPLALLLFFLLKQTPFKSKLMLATIFFIGALLPLIFWQSYIFSKTGGFFPLSNMGVNSIVYAFTSLAEPSGEIESLEKIEKIRIEQGGIDAFYILIQEFFKKPLFFLKLIGLKIVRAWYATSKAWWEGKILAVQFLYLGTGFFGLLYAIKKNKDKIREIIFLLSIIFYFWGITFLAISILRYMVPVMGFIIIFSALTLNYFYDTFCFNNYSLQK